MQLTAEFVLSELEKQAETLKGFGVKRIGLFGSVARGEATPDSDLDFLVELREHNYNMYCDTLFFLEDLFKCKVDLVEWGALRPRFVPNVLEELIHVQGL